MNKLIIKQSVIGFAFCSVIGTIMHFAYALSGRNTLIALISSVNESPCEHMKLLFFPVFGYAIFMQIKHGSSNIIFTANYAAVLLGMWSTLSFFYTINGCLGTNSAIVNIFSYFVGMAVTFTASCLIINSGYENKKLNRISLVLLAVTSLIFFVFTFAPPELPLFQDPVNKSFGI